MSSAHLELLRQDVAAWNNWRDNDPDIEPELAGVDLSGTDLSEPAGNIASQVTSGLNDRQFCRRILRPHFECGHPHSARSAQTPAFGLLELQA